MRLKSLFVAAGLLAGATALGTTYQIASASDHDDGELDLKSRALNLTDHYAFKSGTDLSLVMYVNPRSLPQRQYDLSTNARYEFHVTKVANKTAQPSAAEDYVFRFEAGAPNPAGVQSITLTVIRNGTVIGTHTGTSTDLTTASRICRTSGSSLISAEPAALLQTFFAGQPMLMSMICAPASTLRRAAAAIESGAPPAICTTRGAGSSE